MFYSFFKTFRKITMITKNKKKILALAISAVLGSVSVQAADSVLLDTLLQNGSITPAQYENLTKQKAAGSSAAEAQSLNEVLLQNGVINQVQYDKLTKQAVTEVKPEATKKSGDDVIVKLDQKGFRVETADKAFKFKLGGRIQLDTNFSANGREFDPAPTEGFEVRRARLYAAGTVWTDFDYKAQFDFAGNKVSIKDLFVKYKGLDWFDVTVGNQKQAMSLELQESSNDIVFTERSLVSSLSSQFDRALGVRFSSKAKNWSAQLGAYGAPIAKAGNGGWGISSRATYAPIMTSTHVLHLGGSVGYRGNTSAGGHTNQYRYESTNMSNVYFTNTGSIDNVSGSTLLDIEAAYMFGPFSLQAEYAHNWSARENSLSGVDFGAYYVQGAWTITGESRRYKGSNGKFGRLHPENPVSWDRGTWGAWELAYRIDGNDLNSGNIVGGEETAMTLALNWYLNTNIRLMADYRYAFDIQDSAVLRDGVSAETGVHAFTVRTQLTF